MYLVIPLLRPLPYPARLGATALASYAHVHKPSGHSPARPAERNAESAPERYPAFTLQALHPFQPTCLTGPEGALKAACRLAVVADAKPAPSEAYEHGDP